jgi:hypothetical protein
VAWVAVSSVSSVMPALHSQPSPPRGDGPVAEVALGGTEGGPGNRSLNGHSITFLNAFRLGIRGFRA